MAAGIFTMDDSKRSQQIIAAYEQGYRANLKTGDIISPSGRRLSLFPKSKNAPYLQFSVRVNYNNFDLLREGDGIVTNLNRCNIDVHRFIAYCKYGYRSLDWPVIRHLDDNKINNRGSNLTVGTHFDNAQDRIRNRRRRMYRMAA